MFLKKGMTFTFTEWCQFLLAIVDAHATHSHRLSTEIRINTVKTHFALFENLLKTIDYN